MKEQVPQAILFVEPHLIYHQHMSQVGCCYFFPFEIRNHKHNQVAYANGE